MLKFLNIGHQLNFMEMPLKEVDSKLSKERSQLAAFQFMIINKIQLNSKFNASAQLNTAIGDLLLSITFILAPALNFDILLVISFINKFEVKVESAMM